ncbi:hypothetical protein GCM10020256_46750 [Streptomyces thermocoprophilus]
MTERSPAPGGLALVESLVNTIDLESGADALDTAEGRARFGLTEPDVDAARELRESLRAALLAHAGHPPHRTVTPLAGLLAAAPLVVTVDPADGSAALAPRRRGPAAVEGGRRRRRGGRGRHLDAAQGLRGGHLPLGVLRPQPGRTQPLVLDAGVRGAREDAALPGEGRVSPGARGAECVSGAVSAD